MFKRISWYLFYRKTILKNKDLLYNNHNVKIDWVNRLYKTYSLSDEELEDIKLYGNVFLNNLIEKDNKKLEKTLFDLGIQELVALIELEQLNDRQIGVAFRFKYIDTAKIANILLWSLITILITLTFYLINYQIRFIYFGLISSLVIYLISRLFKLNRIE